MIRMIGVGIDSGPSAVRAKAFPGTIDESRAGRTRSRSFAVASIRRQLELARTQANAVPGKNWQELLVSSDDFYTIYLIRSPGSGSSLSVG